MFHSTKSFILHIFVAGIFDRKQLLASNTASILICSSFVAGLFVVQNHE